MTSPTRIVWHGCCSAGVPAGCAAGILPAPGSGRRHVASTAVKERAFRPASTLQTYVGFSPGVLMGLLALLPMLLLIIPISLVAQTAPGKDAGPKVELNAASAQPRALEDTTEVAIARDYAVAWKALASAMSENRTDALNAGFVGTARDNFAKAIEEQKRSGLRRRFTDRGHKLEAIFYSPEGSTMQLRDTAQLEVEVLEGDTVIHREQITQPYLVLMTVAEGGWKVRVLEEQPK